MASPKKLYRSKKDRWISGVCGGLAEYFNVDPIIVRLLFIIFAAVPVYIILLLFVDENPKQK
jgi:phage shock protein C